jgi:hypothetical protein
MKPSTTDLPKTRLLPDGTKIVDYGEMQLPVPPPEGLAPVENVGFEAFLGRLQESPSEPPDADRRRKKFENFAPFTL